MNNYQPRTRVLVFSLAYYPFIGGAEIALQEIIQRLPDIQFDLITARLNKDLSQQEKIGHLTVYRVGQGHKFDKYLYPLRAFLLAKKLQQQNHYHLIWSMMATWAGIPALWFKLKFSQVKYLLTLQSGDPDLFIWLRTWFWYPIYKMIYSRADHIQVISRWLVGRARHYGYQKEISLIPNGVNLDKFKPLANQEQQLQLRQKLNLPIKDKIIFTSSRLVKKNNLSTLIKSIKLLVIDDQLPVTLVMAGTGKLEQHLELLVKNFNLKDKVIFLGEVPHNRLVSYYQAADIFVRPSLSEGQGISFIEAMACGLPVIATPAGGIVDFLKHQETGLFCQPDSPQDLAEKIKLLLVNQPLVQNIKTNSLRLVQQNYNWDRIAGQMRELIIGLVD